MIDHHVKAVVELTELSSSEMEQMQGGAVCHGVSVLAWARVDGVSRTEASAAPYQGRRSSGGYVPT